MALVDHDQPIPAQAGQLARHARDRQNAGAQSIPVAVVLPHRHEVLRAEDQRLQVLVVLEHAGQRGRHERLAQPHHVADEDAPAAVQVVGGDLHRRGLKVEQGGAEVARDAELGQAGARLLRQVVGHLDVDVVRRNRRVARPTRVDDLRQFVRDVHAPAVGPACLEPAGQLPTGVVVQHVDVEFALPRQAGLGQVAAAQIADGRVDRVGPEQEVELGVQRMAEEELDDDFPRPDLRRQPAQAGLVSIGRRTQGQLFAEFLGQPFLEARRRLSVECAAAPRQTMGEAYLLVRQPLHADEQPAASPGAARPSFDVLVDGAPAAQIEIADAEIRALGHGQGFRQRGEQVLFDVVENSRHAPGSSWCSRIRRPREKPSPCPSRSIRPGEQMMLGPGSPHLRRRRTASRLGGQWRVGPASRRQRRCAIGGRAYFTTACRSERKYTIALRKRAA